MHTFSESHTGLIWVTAEEFSKYVCEIAQALNEHIDDIGPIHEFVGFLNLCAFLDPPCVTIEHWRSLLPLSETMNSLNRLFKVTVAPGDPDLLTTERRSYLFAAVHLYCVAIKALLPGDILLQDGWKRGELYRLLSGIALALDYISHPLGFVVSLKATFEAAEEASSRELQSIETTFGFTLRSFVDMVSPLLILNKIFTGSGLPLDNPELELLRRNVLKQELVAGTVITLCQAMAYGVQGKYIQHGSKAWELFLDVWQHVPSGKCFPELAKLCGRAALQTEGSTTLWLLFYGITELEVRLKSGEQKGAAEWKRQDPHLNLLLEFICSWATVLSIGINSLSNEGNEHRGEDGKEQVDQEQTGGGSLRNRNIQLQDAADPQLISDFQIAISRLDEGIESCKLIISCHRKHLGGFPGLGVVATAAAASLSVLRLSTCLYSSEGFPPKTPLFTELCTASESWIYLMQQVFESIEKSQLDMALFILMDNLELLSESYSAALIKAESVLDSADAEKSTELVIPALHVLESLHVVHAVMYTSLGRWPELADRLQFLYNPLSNAVVVTFAISSLLSNLKSEEMPPEQYMPIIKAAANAVQAACKSSLSALALPGRLLQSVYPVDDLEDPTIDGSSAATILTHVYNPQAAFILFSEFLEKPGKSLQLEYEAKRTALVLQLLKVIDHVPKDIDDQVKILAQEEDSPAFKLLDIWTSRLSSELPAVCLKSEPGLDTSIWLIMRAVEAGHYMDVNGVIPSLIELMAKLDAGPSDVDATVKQRALVLSNLQCANLSCSNVRFPWEKKKPMVCSGCMKARYCSEVCQKADWKAHKRACQLLAKEEGT